MVSASKWSLLSEAASKAIAPITFLLLARLLDPNSFGIFALSTLVITFTQVLWDSGLSKALIQTKGNPHQAANVVFFVNVTLGLLLYLLILLSAQKLAVLLNDMRLETVLRVQGLQVVTGSAASVQNALFQRRMDFKVLFRVRMAAILIGSASALCLAGLGYGYWALVVGFLIGDVARGTYLWIISPWRPQWSFHFTLASALWAFGGWILLEELLAWFIIWGDCTFVGIYLGAQSLGIYRTGSLIVALILSTLVEPLVPVTFSGLSRIQGEKERFNAYVDRVTRLFSVIALPIGAALLALRQPIAEIVMGEKWDGIQPVIGTFAIATAISYALSAFPPAFRASGQTKAFALLRVVSFCYILPIYLFSIRAGLMAFLYARIGVTLLTMLLYAFMVKRFFQYRILSFFKSFAYGLFGAFALWGTTVTLKHLFGQVLLPWHQVTVVLLLLIGLGLHLLLLSKDRPFFRQIARLSIGKA